MAAIVSGQAEKVKHFDPGLFLLKLENGNYCQGIRLQSQNLFFVL